MSIYSQNMLVEVRKGNEKKKTRVYYAKNSANDYRFVADGSETVVSRDDFLKMVNTLFKQESSE